MLLKNKIRVLVAEARASVIVTRFKIMVMV